LRSKCEVGEILISVPSPPKIDTRDAYVQITKKAKLEIIDDFFPVDRWLEAYILNKYRGFVYAPEKYRNEIRDAAIPVIKELFGLSIIQDVSDEACHIS